MSSCEAIISLPAMFSVLGSPHKVVGFSLRPHGESVGFGNVKFHLSWVMEFHPLIEQLQFPLRSEANSKATLCHPTSLPPFLMSPLCLPHPAPPA